MKKTYQHPQCNVTVVLMTACPLMASQGNWADSKGHGGHDLWEGDGYDEESSDWDFLSSDYEE